MKGDYYLMHPWIKPLICFLIAVLMGTLFLVFKTPPIRRDSKRNRTAGIEISEGRFAKLANERPGYILFLGGCFKIFGRNDNAVRLIQVFISALTALLVYYFAKKFYGENIGFIAGLLYSFCPTFAHYPGFLLRATLKTFFFFLTYLLIDKAFSCKNLLVPFFAVTTLIVLSAINPEFCFFGVFASVLLAIVHRKDNISNGRSIRNIIIIAVLPMIFLSGLMYWAYEKNRFPIPGGILLYSGSELALSNKEKAARVIGLISRNLSEKIFPEIDFHTLWPYPAIANTLKKEALEKYSGRYKFFQRVVDLYKEHPFGYVINRVTTLIRLNAFIYPSRLNETDRWKDFYNRSGPGADGRNSWFMIIADLILKLLTNPFCWAVGGFFVM